MANHALDENLQRYQVLLQHRQHMDNMFWSRIQTLHAIQAGVLVSGYLLRAEWYGEAIFGLGAFLTLLLGLLAVYDWSDARVNEEIMFNIGDSLGIRWSSELRGIRKAIRGHTILYILIGLFFVIDIFLACYF